MSTNGVVVRADKLPAFRTIEEWGNGLRWLVKFHREWKWRIAEYLVKGQDRFNEQIWQYIDPSELRFKTQQEVSNAIWTYRRIGDQYNAGAELSFDMWRELASLKPKERDPFITRALKGEKVHRDEIRALAASRNGGRVNGASRTSDASERLPDALEAMFVVFGEAMATCGAAIRHGNYDALKQSLDDLIAKAMELRAKL